MNSLCETCADKSCMGYCANVVECEDYRRETNYDHLVNKSPEEMADFIFRVRINAVKEARDFMNEFGRYHLSKSEDLPNLLEWLKAEYEEGNQLLSEEAYKEKITEAIKKRLNEIPTIVPSDDR